MPTELTNPYSPYEIKNFTTKNHGKCDQHNINKRQVTITNMNHIKIFFSNFQIRISDNYNRRIYELLLQ